MILKRYHLLLSIIFLGVCFSCAESQVKPDADQKINDFSLAGFGERGRKTWDINGKSADIYDTNIKLKDIVGNLYGEEENIKLTADKGDFNKARDQVHLEQNVVITTSKGARLTTNSMNWDRKNQTVNTKDRVNIVRENMIATALGANGHPNLNKVNLEKEVQVEISSAKENAQEPAAKSKTVITCDGPLEIDYQNNTATFKNNVKVDNKDAFIYSDIMDVYFAKPGVKETVVDTDKAPALMGSKIEKLIARGNVKIVKGENTSYSDEATYLALEKRIILTGRPRLVLSSTDELKGIFPGN